MSELNATNEQYLVILSHSLDDVPVRIFNDKAEAMDFAKTLGWEVPDCVTRNFDWHVCSTPVCISVATFRNGQPFSRVIVRHSEDEGE